MDICPFTGLPCNEKKTVHITDIEEDIINEYHACSKCSSHNIDELKSQFNSESKPEVPKQTSESFSLFALPNNISKKEKVEALKKLIEKVDSMHQNPREKAQPIAKILPQAKCPKCKSTITDILNIGRMGCPECYKFFRTQMLLLLKQVHGETLHIGKRPKCLDLKDKIAREEYLKQLRLKLTKAVEIEDYKQAAKLRDELKKLSEDLT